MITDSIVQEVRDARASIAAEFDYDLSKYLVWIREQTKLRKETLGNSMQNKTLDTTEEAVKAPVARKRRIRAARVSS
ncbi:MAG: hypothetical protein SFY80_05290 [Verrucomicrobiota bacterium]|nr:hypothetical protein [Verrucomicrobiota bacterium]